MLDQLGRASIDRKAQVADGVNEEAAVGSDRQLMYERDLRRIIGKCGTHHLRRMPSSPAPNLAAGPQL
jgi:hypothetical protein